MPVASGEPVRLGRDAWRVLAHDRSRLRDPCDELRARSRIADVDARAQDRDRPASGVQGAAMRGRVDPVRRAAHDADAGAPESTAEVPGDLAAERGASPRPDDRDPAFGSIDAIASHEQRDRWVVQLDDRRRVLVVVGGQEPCPGLGARPDDGIGLHLPGVHLIRVAARPAGPDDCEGGRRAALLPAEAVKLPRRDAAKGRQNGDRSPFALPAAEAARPARRSECLVNRLGQGPLPRTPRGRTAPRRGGRPRCAVLPRGPRRYARP